MTIHSQERIVQLMRDWSVIPRLDPVERELVTSMLVQAEISVEAFEDIRDRTIALMPDYLWSAIQKGREAGLC